MRLRDELVRHADRPLRIGSFSAASNVTGIVSDTDGITALLHEHGALAFWDYAAAAPYVRIAMRAARSRGRHKDAVFLSPHKLIGGPSTPGVLVVRRELCTNRVPDVPGGGTVSYVASDEHHYLDDVAHREEGGTPAIIESIRAGLVFQLKEAVGVDLIRAREATFLRRAVEAWSAEPAIQILGNTEAERLSIVSFVVRTGSGASSTTTSSSHSSTTSSGSRPAGAARARGPTATSLLGIDLARSHELEREIAHGCEGIKPGWVRVNFNYFISDTVLDYVIEAVRLVARDGQRLLRDYRFSPATGLWTHRGGPVEPPMRLGRLRYEDGRLTWPRLHERLGEDALAEHLSEGRAVLAAGGAAPGPQATVSVGFDHLRWFELPEGSLAGPR